MHMSNGVHVHTCTRMRFDGSRSKLNTWKRHVHIKTIGTTLEHKISDQIKFRKWRTR